MLRKIRIILATVFFAGITLLFLDFTGALHTWLGWMAKIQFLPAVMALNVAVIAVLVVLTLIFGRIYCSVICPLGVFQDIVAHQSVRLKRKRKNNKPYSYSREKKWLRYTVWVLFVLAIIFGINSLVALLAPYSAWGRIVQNLFQPVYIWCNNLFALAAERAGSYAFYSKSVWMRSLPTFIVAAVTLVAVVILAWRGGRTWCNTICPVGTTLSFFSRFAMLRPVIDADKCRNCKACEHKCKASCIDVANHKIDYSRCVDCFNCIDDCKFGALKYRVAWGKIAGQAGNDGRVPGNDGRVPGNDGRVPGNDERVPGNDERHARPDRASSAEESTPGRRAFITGAALVAGSIALGAQDKKTDGGLADIIRKKAPEREVPLTPPGSKSVKDFYSRCTACQLCVSACPNNVLRPSSSLEHLMQPEMSFEKGYCRPECTRCSEVCPTGAISKITREQKTRYKVGLAQVNRDLCISSKPIDQNDPENKWGCGNCARHCPAAAIEMIPVGDLHAHIPIVKENLCIGCGTCENLCPVGPVSAITVNGRHNHLIEN